jgi:hypothetical protein
MSTRKEPTILDYKMAIESIILHQTTIANVNLESLGSIYRVNLTVVKLTDENKHLYSEAEIDAITRWEQQQGI